MNKTIQSDTLLQMGRISRKLFSGGHRGHHGPMGRSQGMILDSIINNPDISQDELAAQLKLDKTTIAKAVKKMEMRGIVTREKSSEDARKYKLKAQPKAEEIRDFIAKMRDEKSELAFEGIEQTEIESFRNTLNKIEENIEKNKMKLGRPFMHIGNVIDILVKGEGISQEELNEKLGMDAEQFEKMITGLKNRELIEEKDGKLFATQKAADIKQRGAGSGRGRGRHRGMRQPHE